MVALKIFNELAQPNKIAFVLDCLDLINALMVSWNAMGEGGYNIKLIKWEVSPATPGLST